MYTIKSRSTNTVITSGVATLGPSSNSFTKQCFINTPIFFEGEPTIQITIASEPIYQDGKVVVQATTKAFVLVSLEKDINNIHATSYKVTAIHIDHNEEVAGNYVCYYTFMGIQKKK